MCYSAWQGSDFDANEAGRRIGEMLLALAAAAAALEAAAKAAAEAAAEFLPFMEPKPEPKPKSKIVKLHELFCLCTNPCESKGWPALPDVGTPPGPFFHPIERFMAIFNIFGGTPWWHKYSHYDYQEIPEWMNYDLPGWIRPW